MYRHTLAGQHPLVLVHPAPLVVGAAVDASVRFRVRASSHCWMNIMMATCYTGMRTRQRRLERLELGIGLRDQRDTSSERRKNSKDSRLCQLILINQSGKQSRSMFILLTMISLHHI